MRISVPGPRWQKVRVSFSPWPKSRDGLSKWSRRWSRTKNNPEAGLPTGSTGNTCSRCVFTYTQAAHLLLEVCILCPGGCFSAAVDTEAGICCLGDSFTFFGDRKSQQLCAHFPPWQEWLQLRKTAPPAPIPGRLTPPSCVPPPTPAAFPGPPRDSFTAHAHHPACFPVSLTSLACARSRFLTLHLSQL